MKLCHRCEYRAMAHEERVTPLRMCSMFGDGVYACPRYLPVKPVTVERSELETGGVIGIPEMRLCFRKNGIYWEIV